MCSQKKMLLVFLLAYIIYFCAATSVPHFLTAAYKCFEFFASEEIRFLWFFIFRSDFFSVIHDGRTYADVIIKFSA